MPLQIGAPDVAFPRLNAFGFWLTAVGGILMLSGFFTPGGAADFGWTMYSPLSDSIHSPGVGSDMWILGVGVGGIGTIVSAINMITTILCLRAPGMTMFRLPIFTWNIFVTSILALLIFPMLTAAALGVLYDRKLGGHIYDPANGGAVLWQHLFWFFGHPEVYVLALPFFGIVSEIVPVFSRKPMFGYAGLVFATLSIATLSMAVWAHHMFVTGAILLPFFSFMTFLISVPTGVKFFNWVGTMWRGHLTWETPMIFAFGFMVSFLFGGLTGVMMASPPLDFHISDTYFIVAHFHYTLFGTIVFASYGGVYFWFPKMTGRMLDERLGKIHFWMTFLGFHGTFLIQHWLGNMGMPRRYADYLESDGFTLFNQISHYRRLHSGRVCDPVHLEHLQAPGATARSSLWTIRGATATPWNGQHPARRRATTSCRCRVSVPSAPPSSCTIRTWWSACALRRTSADTRFAHKGLPALATHTSPPVGWSDRG